MCNVSLAGATGSCEGDNLMARLYSRWKKVFVSDLFLGQSYRKQYVGGDPSVVLHSYLLRTSTLGAQLWYGTGNVRSANKMMQKIRKKFIEM